MNDNRDVDLDPQADDETEAEINARRLNCISQILSARPITLSFIEIVLTQRSQPEQRKRRRRHLADAKGDGA